MWCPFSFNDGQRLKELNKMEIFKNIMNIRRYIALAADTALNNNITNLVTVLYVYRVNHVDNIFSYMYTNGYIFIIMTGI